MNDFIPFDFGVKTKDASKAYFIQIWAIDKLAAIILVNSIPDLQGYYIMEKTPIYL